MLVREHLPRFGLDYYISANGCVRRLGVELNALKLESSAVLEPGDFVFESFGFGCLFVQFDVGVNHGLASLLQSTV